MDSIPFTREIPLRYHSDVAVIGGGPSGFCAAVAAARSGASVLLIEEGGFAGGMATRGLVGPFMTSYDKDGKQMIIRGLFEEVVNRLVKRGGAIHPRDVRAGTAARASAAGRLPSTGAVLPPPAAAASRPSAAASSSPTA